MGGFLSVFVSVLLSFFFSIFLVVLCVFLLVVRLREREFSSSLFLTSFSFFLSFLPLGRARSLRLGVGERGPVCLGRFSYNLLDIGLVLSAGVGPFSCTFFAFFGISPGTLPVGQE